MGWLLKDGQDFDFPQRSNGAGGGHQERHKERNKIGYTERMLEGTSALEQQCVQLSFLGKEVSFSFQKCDLVCCIK